MRRLAVVAVVLASLPTGIVASAQTTVIALGTPNRNDATLRIPVSLTGAPKNQVSAMDFELLYDPRMLRPVGIEAGAAAIAAGKEVQANVTGPGKYKVLMFGFNQTTMSEGDVAYVSFRIMNEPDSGSTLLRLANTTLSQIDATAVPSRGDSLTIKFGDNVSDEDSEDRSEEFSESDEGADADSKAAIPLVARRGGFDSDFSSMPETTNPTNTRAEMRGGAEGGSTGNREALARALRKVADERGALPGGGLANSKEEEGGASSESNNVAGDRLRARSDVSGTVGIGDQNGHGVGSTADNSLDETPLDSFLGQNRRGALAAVGIVVALLSVMWFARRKIVT